MFFCNVKKNAMELPQKRTGKKATKVFKLPLYTGMRREYKFSKNYKNRFTRKSWLQFSVCQCWRTRATYLIAAYSEDRQQHHTKGQL